METGESKDKAKSEDSTSSRLEFAAKLRSTVGKKESDVITPTNELRGKLADKIKKEKVLENMRYLAEKVGPLAEQYGGFEIVLGGNSPISTENSYHLAISPRNYDFSYNTMVHGKIPVQNGLSKAWETGVNIAKLIEEMPFVRAKFYFSLDLSSDEKILKAKEMMVRIAQMAREKGIAMLTKTEDHTYDSVDLYTWSPSDMSKIIAELYPFYQDIWLSTPHFLQGSVAKVNKDQIGWVQEPIAGFNGSHSSRMGILGREIDLANARGERINAEIFESACQKAGVRPDKPWLLSAEAQREYLETR